MKEMLLLIRQLGSATTLRACAELKRNCYGFEIKKEFYNLAKEKMINDDALNGILANGQISFNTDINKI